MFYLGIFTPGESVSLERKIESSIFLCIPRDLNILGKSCTTFVIVKIVRNLSRGRSPCQRVNHVKSGIIYFSAFIFSYDTIHVSGTIHTWNRDLTMGTENPPSIRTCRNLFSHKPDLASHNCLWQPKPNPEEKAVERFESELSTIEGPMAISWRL